MSTVQGRVKSRDVPAPRSRLHRLFCADSGRSRNHDRTARFDPKEAPMTAPLDRGVDWEADIRTR
jgi:hypothetical protein